MGPFYFIKLLGIKDSLATTNKNSKKNSSLRNVHQYIFPTLCNPLHSKNSKYAISDIDYRHDISCCMRV